MRDWKAWLICLCLLLWWQASAPGQAQYFDPNTPTTRGLVAWLKALPGLTGGPRWYDLLGRYHGTLQNMQTLGTTDGWGAATRPHSQGEVRFNGSTSHQVDMGDVKPMNGASAFTLTGWLKQTTVPAQSGVFLKRLDTNNYVAVDTWDDGKMYLEIATAASTTNGAFAYTSVVTAKTWFHFAMVFNGAGSGNAGRLQLYLNGQPRTLTYTGTIPATLANMAGNALLLGVYGGTLDKMWNGAMDDIRLYNRALKAQEVQAVMVDTSSTLPRPPSLLAVIDAGPAVWVGGRGTFAPFFPSP